MSAQQLYLIGLGAAVATTFVIWRAGRAYSGALVAALRAGQPQLFFNAEAAFGGIQGDAASVTVAVDGLSNPDPSVRRVAAEVLGNLSVPRATEALVNALSDADPDVREASLRALARAGAASALLDVAALLKDPEPEVRACAIEVVRQLAGYPQGMAAHVRPLLDDPDSSVRTRAAAALLKTGPQPEARDMLRSMAALGDVEERVDALTALGEWGDSEAFLLIAAELEDAHAPAPVRRAAASALARCGADVSRAVPPLVGALAAEDRTVREAAAGALGRIGQPALEATVAALFQPGTEHGAIHALEFLPATRAANAVRRYGRERVADAVRYHTLWVEVHSHGADDRIDLLADSLRDKARYHGIHALRAFGLLDARDSFSVAIDNLNSRDPNQRANALETLESAREAAQIRPLLKVWEPGASKPMQTDGRLNAALVEIMSGPDSWLRACAALAAGASGEAQVRETLARLAQSDPDPVARDAAQRTVSKQDGDLAMDTLQTLPLMQRILFLRRVRLFADLSPGDLKQVAAIASEHYFTDGEVIAYQGEAGNEMFIIVSGEVRVVAAGEGRREIEVARRKPGEYVGEASIISQEPRMASLVAAGEVRMLCIDRKSFESLLRERPETSLAVMRVLCARLREMTR